MKKVLNKLFSRMVITCLLVVFQLFIMIVGIWRLQSYYLYISGALALLSFLVVAYLITKDTNPTVKLAWIVPILLFPVLGGLLYVLYGHTYIPKRLRKNLIRVSEQEIYEDIAGKNACKSEVLLEDPFYRISRYTERYGNSPLYANTAVKYYAMGEDVLEDFLEDLKRAKSYIFMEYFIINHGEMWESVLEILKEKVKDGVEVRIMYDDIGSVFYLKKYYWKELETYGIKCIAFNQVAPFFATIFNNRDHRKITVVDGKIAYTGGFNLADEYINKRNLYGVWKDSGVRFEGDAAWKFTVMFLQMWNISRFTESSYERYKPKEDFFDLDDGYIQPYRTNPLSKEVLGENIYLQMIHDAREYIYIFTPYLIVNNEMMIAMELAAKRGVDVRLVTPAIPDKKMIFRMTQSAYKELLKSGVRIYQYTPGFIHSKCLLADDSLASVGSVNMDNRSFYHHFECGALIYHSKAIKDIKKDMVETFAISEEITLDWCEKHLSRMTIVDAILRLLSPLL